MPIQGHSMLYPFFEKGGVSFLKMTCKIHGQNTAFSGYDKKQILKIWEKEKLGQG